MALYWLAEPDEYAGKQEVEDWAKSHFDVFRKAEARLLSDEFSSRSIAFDPRKELGGINAYWDRVCSNPHIPDELKPKATS
jgi:hypothetical protein